MSDDLPFHLIEEDILTRLNSRDVTRWTAVNRAFSGILDVIPVVEFNDRHLRNASIQDFIDYAEKRMHLRQATLTSGSFHQSFVERCIRFGVEHGCKNWVINFIARRVPSPPRYKLTVDTFYQDSRNLVESVSITHYDSVRMQHLMQFACLRKLTLNNVNGVFDKNTFGNCPPTHTNPKGPFFLIE